MQLHKHWRSFARPGQPGTLRLTPDDSDDIWCLYNVIAVGDVVQAMTTRKVLQENSAGDVVDSRRMQMVLAVRAEKIDVDLGAGIIRVNGKNVKESSHVRLGSYHTLDLTVGNAVTLEKTSWDGVAVEFVEQAAQSIGKADVGAAVFQEGLGFVCTVALDETKVLQRVQVSMPKKKLSGSSQWEKAVEKFYEQLTEAICTHLDFRRLRAIVITAGSTVRDEFYARFRTACCEKHPEHAFPDNAKKFMLLTLPGNQHLVSPAMLQPLLSEPRIARILSDTKSAQETKQLDQFHKLASGDASMVAFGSRHVRHAAERGAVKSLLLADPLFRSCSVDERLMYAEIIDTVKQNGGVVFLFAPNSPRESDLMKLTGIAAVLSFSIEYEDKDV